MAATHSIKKLLVDLVFPGVEHVVAKNGIPFNAHPNNLGCAYHSWQNWIPTNPGPLLSTPSCSEKSMAELLVSSSLLNLQEMVLATPLLLATPLNAKG